MLHCEKIYQQISYKLYNMIYEIYMKSKELLERKNKQIEEHLNESISEFNTIPEHIIKDLKPLYLKTR